MCIFVHGCICVSVHVCMNHNSRRNPVLFHHFMIELKSDLPGFPSSCNVSLSSTGTYKDGLSPAGHVLSDHMLLGSVFATILVIVVTAQVSFHHIQSVFVTLHLKSCSEFVKVWKFCCLIAWIIQL